MTTKATAPKRGRPLRSKTSYAGEVSRLKVKLQRLESDKNTILNLLHNHVDKIDRYEYASFVDRVKYLVRGEL